MTTTADATAAPGTLRLHGVEYRLRPMTYADIGEFERWMQDEHIAVTRRNLQYEPEEFRAPLLKEAYERAGRIHMDSRDGEAIQSTFEGAGRVLWFCLRQDQPKMVLSDVQKLLCDPRTELPDISRVDEAMACISKLTSGPSVERASPKKAVRRTRKTKRVARKTNRKKRT